MNQKYTLAATIMESIENMNVADENMTLALMALEDKNYGIAFRHAQEVLVNSDDVEQRLAALYLKDLAAKGDVRHIARYLEIAYDTDHSLDPVAKLDKIWNKLNQAYKRLEVAINTSFQKCLDEIGRIR